MVLADGQRNKLESERIKERPLSCLIYWNSLSEREYNGIKEGRNMKTVPVIIDISGYNLPSN